MRPLRRPILQVQGKESDLPHISLGLTRHLPLPRRCVMGLFRPNVQEMLEKTDVPGLIKALKNRASDVRYEAAWALGQTADARAVDPLGAALKDGDWDVRKTAAFALGHIRDARVIEPLSAALK